MCILSEGCFVHLKNESDLRWLVDELFTAESMSLAFKIHWKIYWRDTESEWIQANETTGYFQSFSSYSCAELTEHYRYG